MSVALCLTTTMRFVGNVGGKDRARGAALLSLQKATAQLLYDALIFVCESVYSVCLHVYLVG